MYGLARHLLEPGRAPIEEVVMRHWLDLYNASRSGWRNVFPVIVALITIHPEQSFIASSIPGLGACKSTFCKAERRGAISR